MAATAPAPDWLAFAFPGHQWRSLQECPLRVQAEGGAGLELEASEGGYVVDGVDDGAGQDPRLQSGTLMVAINGVPLLGLSEDILGTIFGRHFKDGALLLLMSADELRQASEEQHPQWSVLQVPLQGQSVGDSVQVLAPDLATFSDRASVRAEACRFEGAATASVFLAGARDKLGAARPELDALLAYYKLGASAEAAPAGEEGTETLEVAGMVMQSLPARGRRKRSQQDEEVEPEKAQKTGEDGHEKCTSEELHQYEYMDHTADVILHSWGISLTEAIAQVCVCFFSYMTDLDKVEMTTTCEVEATGHDMLDMLYHLLDEFLFHFGTQFIMCRRVEILEFDEAALRIRARGFGEKFDLAKHPQGTEIKAITMHQMKILTPETLTTEEGTIPRTSDLMEGGSVREGFPYECYVLVDI